MMSGHGQIGRQERSLTQHYPMSDNISGLPPPPPFPSKWISYVYHPLINCSMLDIAQGSQCALISEHTRIVNMPGF